MKKVNRKATGGSWRRRLIALLTAGVAVAAALVFSCTREGPGLDSAEFQARSNTMFYCEALCLDPAKEGAESVIKKDTLYVCAHRSSAAETAAGAAMPSDWCPDGTVEVPCTVSPTGSKPCQCPGSVVSLLWTCRADFFEFVGGAGGSGEEGHWDNLPWDDFAYCGGSKGQVCEEMKEHLDDDGFLSPGVDCDLDQEDRDPPESPDVGDKYTTFSCKTSGEIDPTCDEDGCVGGSDSSAE